MLFYQFYHHREAPCTMVDFNKFWIYQDGIQSLAFPLYEILQNLFL